MATDTSRFVWITRNVTTVSDLRHLARRLEELGAHGDARVSVVLATDPERVWLPVGSRLPDGTVMADSGWAPLDALPAGGMLVTLQVVGPDPEGATQHE